VPTGTPLEPFGFRRVVLFAFCVFQDCSQFLHGDRFKVLNRHVPFFGVGDFVPCRFADYDPFFLFACAAFTEALIFAFCSGFIRGITRFFFENALLSASL